MAKHLDYHNQCAFTTTCRRIFLFYFINTT